ncbi:hypothetical protein OPV22_004343 [Ensete ventricosum]|uniref:Uncharacterized protein n=1 Tax=Ensete ventricosum TaxID=4639 RepID=A0AAV8S3J4_ENSVE|nr:hypothetical protein OPV22_004343 [Ensete ventricosum]
MATSKATSRPLMLTDGTPFRHDVTAASLRLREAGDTTAAAVLLQKQTEAKPLQAHMAALIRCVHIINGLQPFSPIFLLLQKKMISVLSTEDGDVNMHSERIGITVVGIAKQPGNNNRDEA